MKHYFSFQWHITDDCDQRCKHCYIYSGGAKRCVNSMSWAQMEDVLANCHDFCSVYRRRPYFYITGGDPILHPDFWRLLKKLRKMDAPFVILGNPFHLDDTVCARLKELGCEQYQLSLDGLRETHDWFRRPGPFDCTLEKISALKKAGISASVMTTVSGANIAEIPAVIDIVVEHGVDVFSFSRYCPTGGEADARIEPMQYRALLDRCHKKFAAYEAASSATHFYRKDHLWTLYEYEEGLFKIPGEAQSGMIYGGCGCGSGHLSILPTGDLYACRRFPSRVGNALTDRMADVWLCEMERYRDFMKFKKCVGCELMPWCRGCPAVACGTSGGFYDADPQCWKEIER
ncbi:radical SAM/SPASM domain protein, ACGX system [Pyramidobacter piscolens]|uniref:radical SAM/SPASM domain protein, ACGX system n=1 Tax=Pyramidobacter piscolens TaxID=638849 RepID=UPI002AB281D8|nr:radical SAM/SPASM domain protein, ACGX system [Pyramidobacter piscolens]